MRIWVKILDIFRNKLSFLNKFRHDSSEYDPAPKDGRELFSNHFRPV